MKEKLLFYFISSTIVIFVVLPSFCIAESNDIYTNLKFNNSTQANNSLTIAEADVLKSYVSPNNDTYANITLYVNHEALIINNDNVSKNVTIYASIPIKAYKNLTVGNNTIYPKYGLDAIMMGHAFPQYFNPKSIKVLDAPVIEMGDTQVTYTWNNVEIDPMSAVDAAYSNYYCDDSSIYNNTEISLPGTSIISNFSNIGTLYIMNLTIKNREKFRLYPGFNIFFPVEVNGKQILYVSNVKVSSNLAATSNSYYVDGTGNPTNSYEQGYSIRSNMTDYIDAGNSTNYDTIVKGTVGIDNGTGKIYPSLVMNYCYLDDVYNKTGNVTRIWTPVQVVSEQPTNQTKFYYYEVSMFIPENNYFIISSNIHTDSTTPTSGVPTSAASVLMTVLVIGIVAYCMSNKK
jgi:hypothetical protein